MALCSIIIPVHNHAGLTKQCLDALLRTVREDHEAQIIVVDNASRDETAAVLAFFEDRVRTVPQRKNVGFAHACNDGANAASGDYLIFLNNDTVAMPGWLDALLNHAATHPAAGAIGGKLLYPNDTIQHAGMVFNAHRRPVHLYRGFPSDHPAVNKARQFQMVTGACLCMPRKAFCEAGGFDTAFLNGYEDADLCLRLRELGYEVHYCPASVLYHLEGCTEGRFHQEGLNEHNFKRRWGSKVQPDEWVYLIQDGVIDVMYHGAGNLELRVAPELGVCHAQGEFARTANLLAQRAQQVYRLLSQNVAMRTRLADLQLSSGETQTNVITSPAPAYRCLQTGRSPNAAAAALPFGVNLLGFFQSEKGLGQAVRATQSSLDKAGIPTVLNNFLDPGSHNRMTTALSFSAENPYAVNVLHFNADGVPLVARERPDYMRDHINVGYWNWELTWFPPEWQSSFGHLDEVWVPSMFTYDSVRAVSPIPVHVIPFAVSVPDSPAAGADRDRWNLSHDVFTFLFAFDFQSYFARKNPTAVIEAFRRAFGKRRDVQLVLKTVHAEDKPLDRQELHKACAGAPNIRLFEETLTRDGMYSLMRSCDAYVALHRCEGYGLLLAEAMAIGKPVIATGYSSNVDFMTPANSLLVRYRLVEVEKDHGPYRRGATWAEPDVDHAAELMSLLAGDRELAHQLGAQARHDIGEQLSPERIGRLLLARLKALTAGAAPAPRQVASTGLSMRRAA